MMKTEILIAIISSSTAIIGALFGFASSQIALGSTLKIETKKMRLEVLIGKHESLCQMKREIYLVTVDSGSYDERVLMKFLKQCDIFDASSHHFPLDVVEKIDSAKKDLHVFVRQGSISPADFTKWRNEHGDAQEILYQAIDAEIRKTDSLIVEYEK